MAQYGDSSNILRPPFRRQSSEAQPPQGPQTNDPVSNPAEANAAARRRNLWRQHQQLSFSANHPNPPTPPPQPPRPRPSLQLPQPKASAKGSQTEAVRDLPSRPESPAASSTQSYGGSVSPPPEPRLKYPARPKSGQSGRSTRGASPTADRRSSGGRSAKVTPLSTARNPADSQPGQNNRRSPRPRRPGKPTPLPVLYGIRLLIFGIGIAAIAGTLLSVLSPTNVPASIESTSEPAVTAATSTATGATGATIQSVVLGEELGRLETEIDQLVTLTPGLSQAVFLLNLDTGQYVDLGGDETVSAASTIKVPILVAFLQALDRGELSLNQALVLRQNQVAVGSGDLQYEAVGSRYTALEVATRMIIDSDNTATNMMIDLLGGAERLNQQFQGWGLRATVLRNPLPDLQGTNTTSTRDLSLLLALVDQGGLLELRSRDRMWSIMQRTRNRGLIPTGVAEDAIIANKTGDIKTILADTALIDTPNGSRYVLSTIVQRPENDGRASELIRRTAESVDSEFNQPIAPVGGAPETSVPTEGFSDGIDNRESQMAPESSEDVLNVPTEGSSTPSSGGAQIPQG